MTEKKVLKILKLAEKKARELNALVSIAIVDDAGYLMHFRRMKTAKRGPVDIAIKKAKTAAIFQKETHVLGQLSQPNKPLYGIEQTNGGLVTFAGGLPIFDENQNCIGAIGVSGSTVENDLKIAEVILNL